ncbi:MAG: hypothetical protein GTO02_19320 [Candidatus Dadabacteria bacterium]|nr:hypothetical protein [Candidatus Dadabacteria bacterium]NIQ16460.1 hypothetical protein [Candidatus Dadabacteria bacterium]
MYSFPDKKNYNIDELKISKVKELPSSWSKSDYVNMLKEFDNEDDVDSLSEFWTLG